MGDDGTMRAWRTHEYGERPTDVLQLDTVPIPVPDPGEVRVRVQAIPLNLNDLERITGGNMMVRPELPYSPGMEVMGRVVACGPGAEAWMDRRVVAMPKQAMKPTQTATLKSMGGALHPWAILGNKYMKKAPPARASGTASIIKPASARSL